MAKKTDSDAEPKKEKQVKKKAGICFTIMPFGGWFDVCYKEVFVPAIEGAGLDPRRSDDLFRPGPIINDIWEFTKQAEVVLADLTGANRNVFYELGLAHAIAKPVVIVTDSLDNVPFDLQALRVIEYDRNSPQWGVRLQHSVTSSLKEIRESPLISVLPTFLQVDPSSRQTRVTADEKEILEIRGEMERMWSAINRSQIRPKRGWTMGAYLPGEAEPWTNVEKAPSTLAELEAVIFIEMASMKKHGKTDNEIKRRLIGLGYPRRRIEVMLGRYDIEFVEDELSEKNRSPKPDS